MRLALDYDGTFTAAPEFWLQVIALAQEHGHQVLVATMRTPAELQEIDPRLRKLVPQIVPTSRRPKQAYLAAFGIEPDVWIDDQPQFLFIAGAKLADLPPDPALDTIIQLKGASSALATALHLKGDVP